MSDENDIITETTKALGLGPAAHEFYKDALQPACREIGPSLQAVAKAVSIAMLPLKGAVWSYEQIHDWLAVKVTEKLAHEDPKRITAPKMSIAGPALLNLHFCRDEEELREMGRVAKLVEIGRRGYRRGMVCGSGGEVKVGG